MVTTKLNLSMTEPQVRQIYAKQGDTGRVLDITLDQTPEDGTLRILRPDGVEVTSEAVTGGEVESGETVTFESMTEADVTELTVGIEPVQDLSHGDPSPTNICPITGHDEVTVTRTGKNQLSFGSSGSKNNLTFTVNDDGSVTVSTSGNASGSSYYVLGSASIKANTQYVLSGCLSDGGQGKYGLGLYDSSANLLATDFGSGATYTPTEDMVVTCGIRYWYGQACNGTFYPQLELGSTATAYEPYQGSTYTTSLGQTVYGGTLDMVTGQLVVDKAMVDLSTLSWTRDPMASRFYAPLSGAKPSSSAVVAFNGVSSAYRVVDFNTFYSSLSLDGVISMSTGADLSVRNLALMDLSATDFATAITGQQLVYELATPQTIQLTPQQIKTLVGANNVWASLGDIVNITFTYGGLLSELPSEATEIVGKCYCDVEQNGVSSMPFTLNVKKNERES